VRRQGDHGDGTSEVGFGTLPSSVITITCNWANLFFRTESDIRFNKNSVYTFTTGSCRAYSFPPAFCRHRFRQAGRYATSITKSRIHNFCSYLPLGPRLGCEAVPPRSSAFAQYTNQRRGPPARPK
jgi:hypothetical protein